MKWEQCTLLKTVDTGQIDELGNAITEPRAVMETKARFTPWTNEEIQLDNRGVTRNQQRFAIPINYKDFPGCNLILVGDVEYAITEAIDLSPRYTAVLVKAYKE